MTRLRGVGATKPALLQAKVAAAVWGEVGAKLGDGSARLRPDKGIAAAARFALGVKGRMPDNKARATLESLLGTQVVRRALAALRDDTNKRRSKTTTTRRSRATMKKKTGLS
jgi:hypothetical protein